MSKHFGKLILCIKAADLNRLKYNVANKRVDLGDGIETWLIPRTHAELDPTFLQLIPYIVLRRTSGEMFGYRRGTGGGEDRLHDRWSIGVGGHVEAKEIEYDDQGRIDLDHSLWLSARRELEEEVGFIPGSIASYDAWRASVMGVIFSDADEVSRVHCGILCQVMESVNDPLVKWANMIRPEAGVIENHRWFSMGVLTKTSMNSRLEEWSRIAVQRLPP